MIVQWFYEGGTMMYVVLLAGLFALPMAIVHAAQPKTWSLVIAGVLLAVVLLAGAAGTMLGRKNVNDALQLVDAAQSDELREVGYREASRPITFAAILVALGAIPFAIGEIKRRK